MRSSLKFTADRPLERLLAWVAVSLMLGSLGWSVVYSLLVSFGGVGYPRTGWTLAHWRDAMMSGHLTSSLGLSVYVSAISVGLAALISVALVVRAPRFWLRPTAVAMLSVPLAAPIAVIAMSTYHLLSPGGWISRLGRRLGMLDTPQDFPALVNDRYAIGIMVAITYGLLPLMVLYFANLWRQERGERLLFTAEAIGATAYQARWRVLAPALLYRSKAFLSLFFLVVLGSYEVPLLLGRRSPEMVSLLIQRRSGVYELSDRPVAFALASAYFAIAMGALAWWGLRGRADG